MKNVIAAAVFSISAFLGSSVKADTLPPGAVRFSVLDPVVVDIPEGGVLVITDIIALAQCVLRDSTEAKINVPAGTSAHLQTGVAFYTQLNPAPFCAGTLTGYWMDL